MTTPRTLDAIDGLLQVRPATTSDREQISSLLLFESYVHQHLDWRAPLDWLGRDPYWVVLEKERMAGVLACPPDPDSIAWIRLFAFASHISGRAIWRLLWQAARAQLTGKGEGTAAAIATQRWLDPILLEDGFLLTAHIVLLEWNGGPRLRPRVPSEIVLRRMTSEDLPYVVQVDTAAFEPLWHNSLEALTNAYAQASYASVAEDNSGVIGYQISTGSPFGTHLARLAIHPRAQNRGLGAALVTDLMEQIPQAAQSRLTVNTQADNSASLALYSRLGFRRTGERYPVFTARIH